jgi:hypothetical protein
MSYKEEVARGDFLDFEAKGSAIKAKNMGNFKK